MFNQAAKVKAMYELPIYELVNRAHKVVEQNPLPLQKAKLLSIKTGACPEDCGYCAQSAFNHADIQKHKLLTLDEVLAAAKAAKEQGVSRFCMGGAYRSVPEGEPFERILQMVRGVNALGLQACCTLGMINDEKAQRLKEAGIHAYNHNLDTGEDYYDKVVTTRTYQDRLDTLDTLAKHDISICCGAILGLGESDKDRIDFIAALLSLANPPESIPFNLLAPIKGTPMQKREPGDAEKLALVRMIATCRILFPQSTIRLAAGRNQLSLTEQIFCFYAGANAIFIGERLLTTDNVSEQTDEALFTELATANVP